MTVLMETRFLELLRCPVTGEPLKEEGGALVTPSRRFSYGVDPSGIPLFAGSATPEALAQQRHYDRIAEVYLDNLAYPHTREYAASLDRAFVECCGTGSLGVVAELCCGQADAFSLLAGSVDRGVGVDVSLSMLRAAKQRLPSPALSFVQGDVTRLPLASEVFDHVVMLGGIHHVPDREALFRQVFRILKPGGRFLWREPVSDFLPWRLLRALVYRVSPTLDHETERPLLFAETAPVLDRAGLRLASWTTHGFLGFCLLMNSDVLVVNRLLRFVPGIGAMARGMARLDRATLRLPGLSRAGTIVIGAAVKPR